MYVYYNTLYRFSVSVLYSFDYNILTIENLRKLYSTRNEIGY